MEVDLRKLKLSDQLKKVNEIIDSDFSETSIITNEEAIIKIIPMQILNKKISVASSMLSDEDFEGFVPESFFTKKII